MADLPEASGEPPCDRGEASEGVGIPPVTVPWDLHRNVLSTASFPGCSIIRNKGRNSSGKGTCSCIVDEETHRSLFDFNSQILTPQIKSGESIPEVKVCWNAENLFECKLNKDLTGLKTRIEFSNLPTVRDAYYVLFNGTYWFPRALCGKKGVKHGPVAIGVIRLLAGLDTYSGTEELWWLFKRRLSKGGVQKLRSILALIDGLIMQLILCFPDREEIQSWKRIDQITQCMLHNLLPDYFRNASDSNRITAFEKVKRLRKAIKEQGFNPVGSLTSIDIPREMSFFERILSFCDQKTPSDIYKVAILCQTRASGVPPPAVYLKTMLKIKQVLQEPETDEAIRLIGPLIRPSIVSIHNKVLDKLGSTTRIERFWSTCLDQAKISLSDSGEFFTSSEKGGKLEAARLVLSKLEEVNIRDLSTGEILRTAKVSDLPPGESLFYWACEMFSDRKHCYDRNIMSVRISLVAELGKYRAITVSHLAHSVLLHVLSHVLLKYLSLIPSSESGVQAANHAWNFFKRLSHKNPNANFIFGNKDVYLFSTDWEQATDFTDQLVAQAILNNICWVMGIPQWYRQTCVFALCAPRQVEQVDAEDKTLSVFYTSRGVLMGDPVTKVVLHYYHLVARESTLKVLEDLREERSRTSRSGISA